VHEKKEWLTLRRNFGTVFATFAADRTAVISLDQRPELRSWPLDLLSVALAHKARELTQDERRAWLRTP
jgi:hypothetical protein